MNADEGQKSLSEERFGRFAEEYVISAAHAGGPDLELLIEMASPRGHWDALDVATGGGHTALAVAPLVRSVVASDLTPEMLAAAERSATSKGASNIAFAQAEAERLPFPDGSFDLVTSRMAPHHFVDVSRFLAEAHRVLRRGGTLVVEDQYSPPDEEASSWIDAWETRRDPSHGHSLSEREWRALGEGAGLSVRRVESLAIEQEVGEWARRQECDDATTAELIAGLESASPAVMDWYRPVREGDKVAFVIPHVLIAFDRKAPAR